MKYLTKIALATLTTLSLSNIAMAADAHDHHSMHNQSQIMVLMHEPMMQVPFVITKNVDADFIENMIPHHKGAILSAKELLKTTKNKDLITLANNIITSQEKEVAEFTALLKTLKEKNTEYKGVDFDKFGKEMQALMDDMMKDMSSVKMSNNNDKDFLLGMIPHHKGAVDVSKKILEVTKDKDIIRIANDIIKAQEKEIADMQNYLKAL